VTAFGERGAQVVGHRLRQRGGNGVAVRERVQLDMQREIGGGHGRSREWGLPGGRQAGAGYRM